MGSTEQLHAEAFISMLEANHKNRQNEKKIYIKNRNKILEPK